MTLQKLTDTLQSWCHQGHAQDEVDFVTESIVRVTDHVELKKSPHKDKTLWFCIDAEENDPF